MMKWKNLFVQKFALQFAKNYVSKRQRQLTVKQIEIASQITVNLDERLNKQYGIRIDFVGFTSIYDPLEEEGKLTALRQLRSKSQELEAKIKLAEVHEKEVAARAKTQAAEQELLASKLKSKLASIDSVLGDSTDNFIRELTVLSELLGEETASRPMAVREAAAQGIPIVPQVILGRDSSAGLELRDFMDPSGLVKEKRKAK